MWNTLKRIGEVLGILTVPRLRERHVVRLSKALDKAVNEVERLQAELGIKQQEEWQDYEAATTIINELRAQLAQAEIELADKAFYVREFAAVSAERDGLKAELAAIIEATEQDGCDTALEAVKQLRDYTDTIEWRGAYSDDAFESLNAELAALRERASDPVGCDLAREAYMAALGGLSSIDALRDDGIVQHATVVALETVRRWDAFLAAVDAEGGE